MKINNMADLDKEITNIVNYANLLNQDKLKRILKQTEELKEQVNSKEWYLRNINEALQDIYENIENAQQTGDELSCTFNKFKN